MAKKKRSKIDMDAFGGGRKPALAPKQPNLMGKKKKKKKKMGPMEFLGEAAKETLPPSERKKLKKKKSKGY